MFQDRLVKALRLAGSATVAAANDSLEQPGRPDWNARVTVTAASATDRHRKRPRGGRLAAGRCWEETRVVARDWTRRWQGKVWQLGPRPAALSLVGRRVVVRI